MYHNTRHFVTPLHIFVYAQNEALQNAALLLGGRPYLRRTGQLIEDLQQKTTLTRRITAASLALHELLTLEHVHDIDRPEAAYFAQLDPSMPCVAEICFLSDGFGDAIRASGIPVGDSAHTPDAETESFAINDWGTA